MSQRLLFLTGYPALWVLIWGVISITSLSLRPPMPGMELNTMAIAWEMWRESDFLLPDVSQDQAGPGYPLYFWLIHIAWSLFGVSETWPRLLPSMLGLANTFMIAALCRALWPGWAGLGALGGIMAMGMIGWLVFSSVAGNELLFSLCILVALFGLVSGWRHGTWDGFILLGAGVGFGFLSNGVTVLIPILPVAMLSPLWAPSLGWPDTSTGAQRSSVPGSGSEDSAGWRQWYVRLAVSLLIAVLLVLGWAVPAIMDVAADKGFAAGLSLIAELGLGSAFTLINPSHVSVSGVAGDHPWWLYPLALAIFLLPWLVWPTAWRAVGGFWPLMKDGGGRFCLVWLIVPVGLYAFMPGADPHDVPLHVPPLAMIAAYLLYARIEPELARQETDRRFANGEAVLGILMAILGLGLIVAPLSGGLVTIPWWIEGLSGAWGLVFIGTAAVTAYAAPRMVIFRATLVTAQMTLVAVVGMLVVSPLLRAQLNIKPPASHLRQILEQDTRVAFVEENGFLQRTLSFPARLEQSVTRLDPDDSIGVVAWAAGQESGQVVVMTDQLLQDGNPVAVFPYLGQYIVFWPAETIAVQPDIVFSNTAPEAASD